jgi:hypothetical protein
LSLGVDAFIILMSKGPLACGPLDDGTMLAGLLTLLAVAMVVVGPAAVAGAAHHDARGGSRLVIYPLALVGVMLIVLVSIWSVKSAWGAAVCGSWW